MFDFLTGSLSAGLGYIVPMVVLLGLLVFVHELGHYLAAIYYGVKVETFSLGFGPKLIKFVHKETVYCVSAIPLGGYVKMYGDEPGKDIPAVQKRGSFLHQPVGPRIVITLAGPLMNLFFAAVLFLSLTWVGDKALAPEVGEIATNSEAYYMGFRPYDKVVSINDQQTKTWEQVTNIIEASGDQKLSFTILRNDVKTSLEVTPKLQDNDNIFSTANRIGKIKGLNSNLHFPFIGVTPGGNMERSGFVTGDRIVEINGKAIKWFKDIQPSLSEAFAKGESSVKVKIHRLENFRKQNEHEEKVIELNPQLFANQNADIFTPGTVVAEVQKDSPAMAAGLKRLDRIAKINDQLIISFDDIVKHVSAYDEAKGPLKIEIERDGQLMPFSIVPKMTGLEGRYGEKEKRFTIGVVPALFVMPKTYLWKSESIGESLTRAWDETIHWTNVTFLSFVRILQNRISSKNVSGIISIGQVAQQSWSIGLNAFLKMMAIISINLFVINLLPIPILDGGNLMIFTLEAIKGAPISLKKIEVAHQVGFFIILFLMAFALFNDFTRLLGS